MTRAEAYGLLSAYTATMKNEEEKRADLMAAMKHSADVRRALLKLIGDHVPEKEEPQTKRKENPQNSNRGEIA